VTGAELLVRSLVASGVDTCFTNPGTSEMHFVAALDRIAGMRSILALFEGVAAGAADGYARMLDRPASTLLHLGPGLANATSALHNARRALSPIVNIVGDHATWHRPFDPPLNADVEALARVYAAWVRTVAAADDTGRAAADAVAAARIAPGAISTLLLPADCAWNETSAAPVVARPAPARRTVDEDRVRQAADALKSGRAALVLNGPVLRTAPLDTCGRIAAATGAELLAPTQVPRVQRGAGRVFVDRIPYVIDAALTRLAHLERAVLVNARAPVAFFAYPGKPSLLLPPGCEVVTLAGVDEDGVDAIAQLADLLGARSRMPVREELAVPGLPSGPITLPGIAAAIAAVIPDEAIVIDESITSGRALMPATRGSRPHDWLTNPGGSIGTGLPLAIGAAVACPERKVVCLESDGSGMYTLQALWTIAREQLNIAVIVFNNRSYQILKGEFQYVGAGTAGPKALDMLEIGRPDIDWRALAAGQGVPAVRVETLDDLVRELRRTMGDAAPRLIEIMM
jgi:acetolactate synthase-1/2/3 large subunit